MQFIQNLDPRINPQVLELAIQQNVETGMCAHQRLRDQTGV